jgi:hypothetical protein
MAETKKEAQAATKQSSQETEGQSLLQIRELLFGEQQRQHEQGFDKLNQSLSELEGRLSAAKSELETALKQASEMASRDLSQVEKRAETSLAAQQKSMMSMHESLDRDTAGLREDHNQAVDSIAEQLSLIRDQLENEQQKRRHLANALKALAEGLVDD